MAHADAAFGRILQAIAARPDAAEIAILVASDHGQISSDREIPLAQLLTAAGHPCAKAADRDLTGAAIAMTGGNMGEIRMLDGDIERRDAVARWLMQQEFIGMVFTPSDDPALGSVEGTLSTALVRLDHARQPELVYVLRSGTGPDAYGLPGLGAITGSVPVGGGMHGGLNRHELNTVLMLGRGARGEGSVQNTPCGLLDLAPTVLDLLGVSSVGAMEGQSLLQTALTEPAQQQMARAAWQGFEQELRYVDRGAARFFVHGGRVA
jgi:arylsulfatase A-like enzyme